MNVVVTMNNVDTGDYVIQAVGHVHVEGCYFRTARSTTAIPKIKVGSGNTDSIVSIGNHFIQDTGVLPTSAPIYDGSGNLLTTDDQAFFGGANVKKVCSLYDKAANIGGVPTILLSCNQNAGGTRFSYIRSTSTNTANDMSAFQRWASGDYAKIRNNANGADLNLLSKDASDVVQLGDAAGVRLASATSTPITKVLKGTVTIDPTSINATTVSSQTFTLTGAVVGDSLILEPPAAGLTAGLLVTQVFVSAANVVTIVFYNTSGAPVDEPSASWTYLLTRS